MLLADSLLKKGTFSHEDNARVAQLLRYAELTSGESRFSNPGADQETRGRKLLKAVLRTYNGELRNLGLSSATTSQATADLVKQEFYDTLTHALAQTDELFNPQVTTRWESDTGAPAPLPWLDDTAEAAAAVAEGGSDPTSVDPVIHGVALPTPSTYRTGMIPISRELVQDSAFDPAIFLAKSFAVRFARGVGPDLVTSLLANAKVGATAAGSATNTGGAETGTDTIGSQDLINLRKSVNPAYRKGPNVGWILNDNTLSYVDGLLTKQGAPVFPENYDQNGRRVLCGFPVFVCPSMPDLATGQKTIAFGNLSYFVLRIVKGYASVAVLQERYAEQGLVAYHASIRANGKLLGVSATDSPVKVIAQA